MLNLAKSRLSGKTLFFIFITCFLSSFLYATIINVPTPYTSIQAGIDAAANGDTVLVQPDTYVENINYNGKLITVASLFLTTQNITYISQTVIDGDDSGSVVTFNNYEDSTAVLCGFTITNGSAGSATNGGGIYCHGSSPNLENVIITSNSASYYGGGIYMNYDSSPSLQNVTITGNSADYGGGIYCRSNSCPNFENVTISGNSADGVGGGIYCGNYSNPILQNVTISGNSANYGGGIWCYESSPNLENVTISDNTASSEGGGIWCHSPNPILITNSILWNNSPEEIYIYSGSVTATYSDIEGGWTGTGNIDDDPLFADPGNGDYHLQPGSPCIDAGDPASPLDPDGTIVEMGAHYFHQHFGPVWHISTTGSDLTGNGSEQNPFATIQHGINCSADTDTVLVQPGTYVENINYNGKLITVASLFLITQDTTYISSTIIDGNSSGSVVTFTNGENSTSILTGFTITNGLGGGEYPDCYGGGITCKNLSNPSLENLIITNNSANLGGGIHCDDSSPSLDNVTISGNSASQTLVYYGYGGGIFCYYYSSPILQNVTISGNSADYGGGIYCYNFSSAILQNVTTSGNSADYGGGIYCGSSSNLSLKNVTITDNSASDVGGGIYCSGGNPSLINSILWNDSPEEIYIASGSVTATYSDIEGGWTGTGNINEDPLFVDPGNGDYHLTWANFPIPDATMSPCIDAGNPVSPLDPDGTTADMGAYYFHQYINADFTADTTNGYLPLTVNFTDLSTPDIGIIDEWYWDFGDGNNSSLQDPANEYLLPGNYTVSLTVTDVYDSTDTETKLDYITVDPPAYIGPVWHISPTGSDVWGNGSTQFPFATIQHGINISADTDTVLVQPGTFVENIDYNGKLITVGSLFLTTLDTTYISSTIIDGNSNGSVVIFENGEDSTAVLCGFTITNGSAGYSDGGGIHCDESSPSLENLIISNNYALHGGGIYCNGSSPSLENVIISNNSAVNGGGIFCYLGSNPGLENVIITGNSASGIFGTGGGVYCNSSSPSLENVTISGNSAYDAGGGIVCFNNSSPSLQNVTISGNSADRGGGICCGYYSSPILQNVTITGNSASGYYGNGGGIYCDYYSSPILQNVTITGNSASGDWGYGGGICCVDYSSPIIENVTITGNSASGYYGYGGGIYCDDSSLSLINSILWNDSPEEIYISSGSVTATYSDIEGGWTGTGNIDEDPLFVDPVNGDYHLQLTSPCIDAGDPASPLDPDGTIADMGAYYFDQTITPDPPQNVKVEIIGTDVHLSWDAVTGANSYKVYSSDDPYTGFVEDTSGTFVDESWSAPAPVVKKFYYVIASTETIRSKYSDSQDVYHPDRKSRRYDSNKFIKRKRK